MPGGFFFPCAGGFGLFSSILTIVFWVILIIAGIYLIRWLAAQPTNPPPRPPPPPPPHQPPPSNTALDILNERYARGEINKAEYEEKRKDIINT